MKRVGVLIVGVSRILHQIVTARIAAEPDMDVVADECEVHQLATVVERTLPDVVLIGGKEEPGARLTVDLLGRHPALKVFWLENQASDISLVELAPRKVHLGQLSPVRLVEVIRQAVGAPWSLK